MLLVLLMLLVFVIISVAAVRFIARQSTQGVLQEQEEQAFGIADAGVNYTLWLLASTGGNFSPPNLVAAPPAATRNHPVTNHEGQVVGTFDLWFGPACPDSLAFRAVGYDVLKRDLCQVIDASAVRFATGWYRVTTWNHLAGYPCDQVYVPPSPPVCTSPSPPPTP